MLLCASCYTLLSSSIWYTSSYMWIDRCHTCALIFITSSSPSIKPYPPCHTFIAMYVSAKATHMLNVELELLLAHNAGSLSVVLECLNLRPNTRRQVTHAVNIIVKLWKKNTNSCWKVLLVSLVLQPYISISWSVGQFKKKKRNCLTGAPTMLICYKTYLMPYYRH